MIKTKIYFIVNPISGVKNRYRDKFKKVVKQNLDPERYDIRVKYTKSAEHATKLAQKASEKGYDIVVAVGGDGTINEIARILMNTNTVLGIIPAGSGNGLARYLKLPLAPIKALKIIDRQNIKKIDTFMVNRHFAISIAGVGFDAEVAVEYAKNKGRGFKTYVNSILKQYFRYKAQNYILYLDGKKLETKAFFISFANSDQFGYGAAVAPTAKISDGKLEVVIVKKFPLLTVPFTTVKLMTGKFHKSKYVEIHKAKKIKLIRPEAGAVNIDGEPCRENEVLKIRTYKKSINLLTP